MFQNLIDCIKLIISNVSVLLIYLINKPIKLFNIKDIQFEYTDQDKKELNELDCYCGACTTPILIGSFFTRRLKYSTD